jgi:guanylate kinase
MKEKQGKLIIICAPSGSGKTTIVKAVLQQLDHLEFSVSATSRQPRSGEENGRDYYFLQTEEFQKRIDRDDFLEWEEVYKGSYYGTLKSELQRIWDKGNHVIFDVDVEGGLSIKKHYPENSLSVFIKPPSLEELKKRLTGRGTETEETLKKRVEKAEIELSYAERFDLVVVNDDLHKAIGETLENIRQFIDKK